jgi:E3 ubiquitin-protein ligase DOA10
MLDSPDPSQKIIVIRHTYPAVFCLAVLVLGCLVFRKLLHLWLQTIRDDAYLIGKRLHNMENESDEATTSSAQTSSG